MGVFGSPAKWDRMFSHFRRVAILGTEAPNKMSIHSEGQYRHLDQTTTFMNCYWGMQLIELVMCRPQSLEESGGLLTYSSDRKAQLRGLISKDTAQAHSQILPAISALNPQYTLNF